MGGSGDFKLPSNCHHGACSYVASADSDFFACAHSRRAHHGISRASASGFHRVHRAACHLLRQTGLSLREISRPTVAYLAALLYGDPFWRDDDFFLFNLRNCLSCGFRRTHSKRAAAYFHLLLPLLVAVLVAWVGCKRCPRDCVWHQG